jgi:hypothetical protein
VLIATKGCSDYVDFCTRTPVARPLEIRAPFRVHVRDVPVRIRPKENVAIDLPVRARGKKVLWKSGLPFTTMMLEVWMCLDVGGILLATGLSPLNHWDRIAYPPVATHESQLDHTVHISSVSPWSSWYSMP